jgi:predicted dehydrogenase
MTMRIGLIGCGDIGRVRATAVSQTPGAKLTAVSDLDANRAGAIASVHGAAVAPDWKSLVRRDDVDVVIVSTPPSIHAEMCLEAFAAGKHVMCEKPLARTPAECRRIVEAADAARRLLATGFNYRFYPSMLKAKELLDSGIIGDLDHVRSYAGYSATSHSHGWIHDVEIMGGGALRDNGIHLIDLTRYFLGEVEQVKGFASEHVWNFKGCEDNGFALLRSTEGKVATLQASWTEWRKYRFLIEIYGSRGCIRASCFPMITEVTWAPERGGRTRTKRHLFPMVHLWEKLRTYKWVVARSFVQELLAFQRALEGQKTPLATGHDGLRAVEIAHLAAQGGGRIDVNAGTAQAAAIA